MAVKSAEIYMQMALNAAKKAWGLTTPNPMVGAVAVNADGEVVAEGWHHKAGMPHAEVEMLQAAGGRAKGCTVYVTLEPCCTYGRTPPCTKALIDAGVGKVVIGCLDPNPNHAGKAVAVLQRAGIAVEVGVLAAECRALNRAFFTWITQKRPFVLLKMAATLDGKTATADGESKWITGSAARLRVQELRRWADAIMVTGKTVRIDKPSLTVREPADWPKKLRKIIATSWMSKTDLAAYFPDDPEVEAVELGSRAAWHAFLRRLGSENITALLLEGGSELAGMAVEAGVVDAVEFHFAPKLLCGRNARPLTGGDERSLALAAPLSNMTAEFIGPDLVVKADIINKD